MSTKGLEEQPLVTCLDEHDRDLLLEALIREHGPGGRPDIAPELLRAKKRRLSQAQTLLDEACT
jgi:hypothetical protein